MKEDYLNRLKFLILNQVLVIVFLCYELIENSTEIYGSEIISLILTTIILINGFCVSFINIRNVKIINKFTDLVVLVNWQFLICLDERYLFYELSILLEVYILYKTIDFTLNFIFQDYSYPYKKITDLILKFMCILTLMTRFIQIKLFYAAMQIQLLLSIGIFIFLITIYRKRFMFVMRNEKKNLANSSLMIIVPILIILPFLLKDQRHIDNLIWYVLIFIPLFSINKIALISKDNANYFLPVKRRSIRKLVILFFMFLSIFNYIYKLNIVTNFILIHSAILFWEVYLMLEYEDAKDRFQTASSKDNSFRNSIENSLRLIIKEEEIKRDISNYLHDEVLQDILSVKNLITKSDNPEIKQLIINTLDYLNVSIRNEMNTYHPVMLKDRTLKENYQNLINSIKYFYPLKNISINFECDETLFLAIPYDLIIYRMIKELVTNAFKHSNGTELNINLEYNEEMIILMVKDNGKGFDFNKLDNIKNQKGLISIKEQVKMLEGSIDFLKNNPSGIIIIAKMPMKGEESYKYFINR